MSMPQGGEPRLPQDTGWEAGASAQQWQGNQPGPGGVPGQGTVPGQSVPGQAGAPAPEGTAGQEWAGGPQGQQQYGPQGQQQYGPQGQQQYGMPPPAGGTAGGQWGGPMAGQPISPVNEIETRVTGRRTVQYIIDAIIYGILASLISWALDRGHGGLHALLVLVTVVLVVAWYLLYWAAIPNRRNGQTLGMSVMGIRVISASGGTASFVQLAVRSVLLVLFSPLSLLVGIIVMMCSRYRQRTGDHMAKTMVVRANVESMPARPEYAGAGQAGTR
jgi:uncharacterized RDD family membrane protein YckC